MIISNRNILFIIIILSLILIPIIYLTNGVPRIILSVIFVLFSPGYVLLSALFPKQTDIKWFERSALSLGISLVIVGTIGLVIHLLPIRLDINSLLFSLLIFILIFAIIAIARTYKLGNLHCIFFTIYPTFINWYSLKKQDKSLTILLACLILVFILVLSFAAFIPNKGENYTEFYILDESGSANSLTSSITFGQTIHCIAGIINHEANNSSYKIIIKSNGEFINEINTPVLVYEDSWEGNVAIEPSQRGENQRFEFWLYKNTDEQPYNSKPLYLIVDVN